MPTKEPQYQIGVSIKETNQENGPGHVSTFVRKIYGHNSKITKHTSFFAGPVGCLINGLSFGSIPVTGQLAHSHSTDLHEAEHVMVTDVTKEQYQQAKTAQYQFQEEVASGKRLYSVFGGFNPLATCMSQLISVSTAAQKTHDHHKQNTGLAPTEDHCGIPVYDNNVHAPITTLKIDNCTTSVEHVLKSAGFKFDNPHIPTFFTAELEKHGFSHINKDHLQTTTAQSTPSRK